MNKNNLKFIAAVLILFCALSNWSQNLVGTKWLLVSIDDLETGVSKDVGKSAKATLSFDSDSTYSGKFCNTYNGNFRHNQDRAIKMGIPVTTRMMCMGLDKYEKEMLAIFVITNKYRVEEDALYLFSNNRKRLTYKREKIQK